MEELTFSPFEARAFVNSGYAEDLQIAINGSDDLLEPPHGLIVLSEQFANNVTYSVFTGNNHNAMYRAMLTSEVTFLITPHGVTPMRDDISAAEIKHVSSLYLYWYTMESAQERRTWLVSWLKANDL